jgi:hypothetical protein
MRRITHEKSSIRMKIGWQQKTTELGDFGGGDWKPNPAMRKQNKKNQRLEEDTRSGEQDLTGPEGTN